MRTAFAIALLAFVGTSNAVKLVQQDESGDNSTYGTDQTGTSTTDNTTVDTSTTDNTTVDTSNTDNTTVDTSTTDNTTVDTSTTDNTTVDTSTTDNTTVETSTFNEVDIVIGACTNMSSSSYRDPQDTSSVLLQGWNNAYSRLTPTADFGWPKADIFSCSDYTIRDQNQRCLTWLEFSTDATTGANAGDLAFQECSNDNPHLQQFDQAKNYQCTDIIGNNHSCVVNKNRASGTCLSGSGRLTTDCETGVMYRTGIAVYSSGHLRNEGSGECLVPVANDSNARVVSADCEDDQNQEWVAFSTGEIKHGPTGYCLGNLAGEQGIMSIQPCSDIKEMAFTYDVSGNGLQLQSLALPSMAAEAIAFQGQAVALRNQDYANLYQYWSFVDTNEWSDAQFTWVEVGCGHGVEMSHSYSEEFNLVLADGTKSSASDSYVMSAQEQLLGETEITNAPAVDADSVEYLTETYSQMMNHPSDPTIDRSHLFTCSGENNCMYRSVMTMFNNYSEDSLEWITGYTRCMDATPQCPPLTSYDSVNAICVANGE